MSSSPTLVTPKTKVPSTLTIGQPSETVVIFNTERTHLLDITIVSVLFVASAVQVGPTTKGLKTLFAPSAPTPCPPSIVSDNQDASNRPTRPKGRANEPNFVFHFILIPTNPIQRIPIQIELFTKGAYTLSINNTNTLMIWINSRISYWSYLQKLYRICGDVD
ncbi:hypothetical protein V1478_009812 [Vespula squamosa]|uniref:Uncharacterized protein n=1 Tax=Vespula squamosa TaxID=30214 RepID=A0ABD2AJI3_VESSQ